MHIGLIGGLGPAATQYYYRKLVAAHKEADQVMKLTIAHADIATYFVNMKSGNKQKQAEIFLQHAQELKGAGCDSVAVSTMAGHFCIDELAAISPLPILNIIPMLNEAFQAKGYEKIGLIGSKVAMESKIYGGIHTAECIAPKGDSLDEVSENYLTMALSGHALDSQRDVFFHEGRRMIEEDGADVIVLAGTDLFLAFDGYDPGFPVVDSADIHIEKLAALSMGN
jgi:aspartate racemase